MNGRKKSIKKKSFCGFVHRAFFSFFVAIFAFRPKHRSILSTFFNAKSKKQLKSQRKAGATESEVSIKSIFLYSISLRFNLDVLPHKVLSAFFLSPIAIAVKEKSIIIACFASLRACPFFFRLHFCFDVFFSLSKSPQ